MTDAPSTALDVLARTTAEPPWSSLTEAWAAYRAERASGRTPFSAAVLVAARGDRLGHAFAVGYPAALEELVPGVELPCALCVTEAEGNGPRAIASTLTLEGGEYRLSGTKTFVTFGTLAHTLIVAARLGTKPDGRPDLAVVQIPSDRPGVELEELPPTRFVPEVKHARLTLGRVMVHDGERLPGDGYLRYVKPFRTIEDIHVIGATLGYVIGWAFRAGVSREWIAELSADLVALDALRNFEPLDPRTHVALHGCHARTMKALASDDFGGLLAAAAAPERERWNRDRTLLDVASSARARRLDAASTALGL